MAQGYGISSPLSIEALTAWFSTSRFSSLALD